RAVGEERIAAPCRARWELIAWEEVVEVAGTSSGAAPASTSASRRYSTWWTAAMGAIADPPARTGRATVCATREGRAADPDGDGEDPVGEGRRGRAGPGHEVGVGGCRQVPGALHAPLGVRVGALPEDEQRQGGR